MTYQKLGCYSDDQKVPRPLPSLILTDRDPTSPVFSNRKIDWGNWDSYISDLACRCAEKAADNGYNFFGLQFYGKSFGIRLKLVKPGGNIESGYFNESS